MTRLFLAAGLMAATLSTSATAQGCATASDAQVGAIEIVQFRLADGVSREDFLAAAANTAQELCEMDGFIGRVMSEGEDGAWTDHVRWTSFDAAQEAMAGSMENENLIPFIMSIDPDSMVLTYQSPVFSQ